MNKKFSEDQLALQRLQNFATIGSAMELWRDLNHPAGSLYVKKFGILKSMNRAHQLETAHANRLARITGNSDKIIKGKKTYPNYKFKIGDKKDIKKGLKIMEEDGTKFSENQLALNRLENFGSGVFGMPSIKEINEKSKKNKEEYDELKEQHGAVKGYLKYLKNKAWKDDPKNYSEDQLALNKLENFSLNPNYKVRPIDVDTAIKLNKNNTKSNLAKGGAILTGLTSLGTAVSAAQGAPIKIAAPILAVTVPSTVGLAYYSNKKSKDNEKIMSDYYNNYFDRNGNPIYDKSKETTPNPEYAKSRGFSEDQLALNRLENFASPKTIIGVTKEFHKLKKLNPSKSIPDLKYEAISEYSRKRKNDVINKLADKMNKSKSLAEKSRLLNRAITVPEKSIYSEIDLLRKKAMIR